VARIGADRASQSAYWCMFIHGARAVLYRVKYDTGAFGLWVHQLEARAPRNKVIVAIANKLARIAWAVLSSGQPYQHQPLGTA
jgi:transposase